MCAYTADPAKLRFMRSTLTALGLFAITAYAAVGALLMNDWAVAAASGVPIDTAIADMAAAGQPFSAVPGYVFAIVGVALALVWAALVLLPRFALPGWAAVSIWAWIVALGAPAYFFASFGNMNSVGDTYFDWNAAAAWALEAPLYAVSAIALVVAIGAIIVAVVRSVKSARASHTPA